MLEEFGARTAEAIRPISTPKIAYAGAFCLGVFLGFVTLAFVVRLNEYTPAALGAIVAMLGGGAVMGLLSRTKGAEAAISWYLIGLLGGLLLFLIAGDRLPLPAPASPTPQPSAPPASSPRPS